MPAPEPSVLRLLLLSAPLALAACAPLPPKVEVRERVVQVQVPVPQDSPAAQALQQLLAQHERLARLTPAELAQEIAAAGAPADDAKLAPAAALQLALTLSLSHANAAELARAQALLAQLQQPPRGDAPEAALARLLASRVAEQRRLEAEIERLNQQARESQRRLDQLNEKLEALKAIERSLQTRPAPAGR